MGKRLLVVAALVAATILPSVGPARAGAGTCDWATYGRDVGRSFAAAPGCSKLAVTNASTLAPSWVFQTPEPVSASPAVVDGTVYVGDWAGNFYALATDGNLRGVPKWTYTIDDTSGTAFGRIVSSAAVTDVGGRRIVLFGGGATLYALDALTGTKLAGLCLDPRDIGALRCRSDEGQVEVESSPAVFSVGREQRVVIGLDVHNGRDVGRTGLVEARIVPSGAGVQLVPVWKFDPEAGLPYTGTNLLTRGSGTGTGCASVWSSPTVDVARRLAVFGTGSCSLDGIAAGESVWGVDLLSGALRWKFSPPRKSTRLDDDFGASPNLLPGGLVGAGSKDGWYYALRESDGTLAWASHVGESGHVNTDFSVGGIIGTPAVGTVAGAPAIFVTTAISTPLDAPLDANGGPAPDATLVQDPGRLLSLSAIRASDGTVLWRTPLSRQSYGAPSFANGVVLVPSTFDLSMKAFMADTGLALADLPVAGAPSSSAVPVGDMVFMGVGTSETDLEFKAFGADAVQALTGLKSPLSPLSGVYGFKLLVP